MRDLFAGRRQSHPAKNYNEQQNKKDHRDGAGIGQQSMASYRAYRAVTVMDLAVDVLMQRDNSQENRRQGDSDQNLKRLRPGQTPLAKGH